MRTSVSRLRPAVLAMGGVFVVLGLGAVPADAWRVELDVFPHTWPLCVTLSDGTAACRTYPTHGVRRPSGRVRPNNGGSVRSSRDAIDLFGRRADASHSPGVYDDTDALDLGRRQPGVGFRQASSARPAVLGGGMPAQTTATGPSSKVVEPKGDRLLGIAVSEAEEGGFDAAFAIALGAGMEVAELPLPWDEIEQVPGVFENQFLATANIFYPPTGLKVSLEVNPIDTNHLRLPLDLADNSWDDPVVIYRFNALLDWVFSMIPDLELTGLSIGNEVDASLSSPADWSAWGVFVAQTAAHARSLRPGLVVGTKATFDGLTRDAVAELQQVNAFTDIVMVTYYPMNGLFAVRPPAAVGSDLDLLEALYPSRRLALLEAGYPSGLLNASSERLQAAFVRQLFVAWDRHPEIGLVHMTWLTDVGQAAVDLFLDYYGIHDSAFAEFLGTLGLRHHDGVGRDKLAMVELRRQAAARGWNVTGPRAPGPRRPCGRVGN